MVHLLHEGELLCPSSFETVEGLREALVGFKHFYNCNWLMGEHGNKTAAQIREESPLPRKAAGMFIQRVSRKPWGAPDRRMR